MGSIMSTMMNILMMSATAGMVRPVMAQVVAQSKPVYDEERGIWIDSSGKWREDYVAFVLHHLDKLHEIYPRKRPNLWLYLRHLGFSRDSDFLTSAGHIYLRLSSRIKVEWGKDREATEKYLPFFLAREYHIFYHYGDVDLLMNIYGRKNPKRMQVLRKLAEQADLEAELYSRVSASDARRWARTLVSNPHSLTIVKWAGSQTYYET